MGNGDDTEAGENAESNRRQPEPDGQRPDVVARLDLPAYLDAVGYAGEQAPTVANLHALHYAHVATIPFENLEILLGRGISLDLDALQDKLIRRGRGGYCYEHTSLFAAVLQRFGYGVTLLAARVQMGSTAMRPETHAILRVTTAETAASGREWIADVGFGSSPVPIELAEGAEAERDGWRRRLVRRTAPWGGEHWVLQEHRDHGWFDLHVFNLEPRGPVDYVVGNHYVSTHPRSPFVARPFVQRLCGDEHHTLDATEWTVRRADGSHSTGSIAPEQWSEVLHDSFGITLDMADRASLRALLERSVA